MKREYFFTREYLPFVAVHEAGHALCALELNMPIKSATLVDEEGITGRILISPPLENSKFTTQDKIAFFIAGDIATKLYIEKTDLTSFDTEAIQFLKDVNAESDLEMIERLLDAVSKDPRERSELKNAARNKAMEILQRKWFEIEAMVNRLLNCHEIRFH